MVLNGMVHLVYPRMTAQVTVILGTVSACLTSEYSELVDVCYNVNPLTWKLVCLLSLNVMTLLLSCWALLLSCDFFVIFVHLDDSTHGEIQVYGLDEEVKYHNSTSVLQ